jgi:hypothetical protein
MPSQALAELSAQIEAQDTDSFGKFYMYATLLNVVAVRDKSFQEALPEQTTAFSMVKTVFGGSTQDYKVKTGAIHGGFFADVKTYQSHYTQQVPDFFLVTQRILLTFIRKGQLSDLVFIIDKMNEHLNTTPLAESKHNKAMHDGISFENHKALLNQFLNSVQNITKLAQSGVDNGIYGILTIIAAVLATKVTMALGGFLLTIAMLAAGGYAAALFFLSAIACFKRIEQAHDNTRLLSDQLLQHSDGTNYKEFILNAVCKPIGYTAITIMEQTAATEAEYNRAHSLRRC